MKSPLTLLSPQSELMKSNSIAIVLLWMRYILKSFESAKTVWIRISMRRAPPFVLPNMPIARMKKSRGKPTLPLQPAVQYNNQEGSSFITLTGGTS